MEEVTGDLDDYGPLHGAPNYNAGSNIANDTQELTYTRMTIYILWVN